jgi:DNA repair protein RecO
MHTVRQAQVLEPHAGLWMEGYRLRAAGSVLEAAMRVLGEQEANDAAFNLVSRGLALISVATPSDGPPRHDPIVLGVMAKLLVVAGILPRLGSCASCGAAEGLVGFSARVGGALCPDCSDLGEPIDSEVFAAFAALVGRPLSGDRDSITSVAASGVERIVGLVLHEHLGVVLRAAAPL